MTVAREEVDTLKSTAKRYTPPFTLFDLRLQLGQRRLWIGPALASLCGAISSGRISLNSASIVSLILIIFLADPLLGAVWTTLAGPDGQTATVSPPRDEPAWKMPPLPYATADSPGDRLSRWINHLSAETRAPAVAAAIGGKVLFAVGIALVLGLPVAVIVGVALGWALFWTRLAGRPHSPGARAVYALGMPWLLGYATFLTGSLLPTAVVLPSSAPALLTSRWAIPILPAAAYAVVGWAMWHEDSLAAANITQLLLVVLLFAVKKPALAVILAFALIFQMALQPHRLSRGNAWYLRQSQWFLAVGMISVAVALMPG
jgi:hypothetical protein